MSSKFCVYKAYSSDGLLLYVGKSINFLGRAEQHRKYSVWFHDVDTIKVIHCQSADEMNSTERDIIKSELPKHNAQLTPKMSEVFASINACKRTRRMLAGEVFKSHVRSALESARNPPKRALTVAFSESFDPACFKADLYLCGKLSMPLPAIAYREMFNNHRRHKNE